MKIQILSLTLFFIVITANAQLLNRPESMEYDTRNNRILVSNKGNDSNGNKGFIVQMDPDGSNQQYFAQPNIDPVNAIEIVGDTVFVACEDGHVYGFRSSNGEQIIKWDLETAEVPNGLSHDKYGNLYVSDARNNDVYKIVIATGNITQLVEGTGIININGVYMDNDEDRLFLCGWENKPEIWDVYAADINTGEVTNVYDGPYAKVDGMARDKCGNYYLSFWSENKVFKYDNDEFENPVLLKSAADGISGPADIGMDTVNNNLLIPNLNNSTVTIVSLEDYCPSSGIANKTKNGDIVLFPNPSKGVLNWKTSLKFINIEIYDANAKLVYQTENIQGHQIRFEKAMQGLFLVKATAQTGEVFEQKLLFVN